MLDSEEVENCEKKNRRMINQWVFGLVILEDVIVKRERYWALGFQFLSRKYVDAGVRVLFGVLRS